MVAKCYECYWITVLYNFINKDEKIIIGTMQPPAEPAETHPAKHQAVQLNKGARGEDEHGDHNGHHQGH